MNVLIDDENEMNRKLLCVNRIIRHHGGNIPVESEKDKWATFFFDLGPADKGGSRT